LLALVVRADAAPTPKPTFSYDVNFDARIVPSEGVAHVTIRLGAHRAHVEWLRFRADPTRYTAWTADGTLSVEDHHVEWHPPKGGGAIRYTLVLDHLRNARAYDARCANDWVILRGHDLVPTVRVRATEPVESRSTMTLHVPTGWKIVTGHEQKRGNSFVITDPATQFDRPTSWILAGRLGIRRETIAGMKVTVAGPVGHGIRRYDMLALLRWTLHDLRDILGSLPDRLTVVSAGDPMWRGGLSAPNSLFLHAGRPLITHDLTSPLLHEVIHAVVGTPRGPQSDWIVEGLAEYYGLQLLKRSKTVSKHRYKRALAALGRRGRGVGKLAVEDAHGEITARAVQVLSELDDEIRAASDGNASLDTVLARLSRGRTSITNERFKALAEKAAGRDLTAFFSARVGRLK
jgi:hypothetical protein